MEATFTCSDCSADVPDDATTCPGCDASFDGTITECHSIHDIALSHGWHTGGFDERRPARAMYIRGDWALVVEPQIHDEADRLRFIGEYCGLAYKETCTEFQVTDRHIRFIDFSYAKVNDELRKMNQAMEKWEKKNLMKTKQQEETLA